MCFLEVVIYQGFKNQKGFARNRIIPKRGEGLRVLCYEKC
jgi:hypothetical protein